MISMKFLRTTIVAFLAPVFALALSSGLANAQTLHWHRIFGIPEAFNVVGSGTGKVTGGIPWVTTSGHAEVNLSTGHVNFRVKGLVLSVGSNSGAGLFGVDIGTTGGIPMVKGTLVCNVSGAVNSGNSVLVDTDPVPFSPQGNARFDGDVGALPAQCGTSDVAFLIRIALPSNPSFNNLWIAAGGVLTVDPDMH